MVTYVIDCDGQIGACNDGADNDGDGVFDWPNDPGCVDQIDTNENDPVDPPACANDEDDDGDGAIDCADANCETATACIDVEDCSNELDDDGDGS